MQLIFEKSKPGRKGCSLPSLDVPKKEGLISQDMLRKTIELPELSEVDIIRHYTALSRRNHGVDNGFYPLGSCTMKYNPKINEDMASLPGFTNIHPYQDAQGSLQLMYELVQEFDISFADCEQMYDIVFKGKSEDQFLADLTQ